MQLPNFSIGPRIRPPIRRKQALRHVELSESDSESSDTTIASVEVSRGKAKRGSSSNQGYSGIQFSAPFMWTPQSTMPIQPGTNPLGVGSLPMGLHMGGQPTMSSISGMMTTHATFPGSPMGTVPSAGVPRAYMSGALPHESSSDSESDSSESEKKNKKKPKKRKSKNKKKSKDAKSQDSKSDEISDNESTKSNGGWGISTDSKTRETAGKSKNKKDKNSQNSQHRKKNPKKKDGTKRKRGSNDSDNSHKSTESKRSKEKNDNWNNSTDGWINNDDNNNGGGGNWESSDNKDATSSDKKDNDNSGAWNDSNNNGSPWGAPNDNSTWGPDNANTNNKNDDKVDEGGWDNTNATPDWGTNNDVEKNDEKKEDGTNWNSSRNDTKGQTEPSGVDWNSKSSSSKPAETSASSIKPSQAASTTNHVASKHSSKNPLFAPYFLSSLPRLHITTSPSDPHCHRHHVPGKKHMLPNGVAVLPEYFDDLKRPMAVIRFLYRTQEQLKTDIGVTVEDDEREKMAFFRALEKEELIEMLADLNTK
jgi:hypothetical protein